MQGAVRVGPCAVGVVRPGWMRNAAEERQPRVVAIVDPVPGVGRVRGAGADLYVRHERGPPVRAEGAPELRAVVGDAVGVAGSAGAEIGAGVIPDDREVPSGRI